METRIKAKGRMKKDAKISERGPDVKKGRRAEKAFDRLLLQSNILT